MVCRVPLAVGDGRRLVIATLRGGLGNQMFQYALGRSIAERHGRVLFLDDRWLLADAPGTTRRSYALHAFNIDAPFVDWETTGAARALVRVRERQRGFHPVVLEPLGSDCVQLVGYWQHEGYFKDIKPILRREFTVRSCAPKTAEHEKAIRAVAGSVCLHVRRQDYLSTPAGRRLGFVGADYYTRAIRMLAHKVPDPHFFVFSDDVPWCVENLSVHYPHTYISDLSLPADLAAASDFHLMTCCAHFIVANSSFSWWAAWLASLPEPVVIAPRTWYRHEPTEDTLVPPHWLRA